MAATDLRLNQKNRYRALWEFAQGVATVASTPPSLQLSRTNNCNFRCVYCSDHRAGNDIGRTKNDGATWQGLLRLIPRSATLAFHGISEFMIDPEFFDIVRRCAEARASLMMNTNGSVCGPRHVEVLSNYPEHLSINFSLDAATPETFLRIRGADFDRIIRNIRTYMDAFEARRHRTWVSLSFVITKSSVKEMGAFVALAKELRAHAVNFYRLHEYESLDWQVKTRNGEIFDYREECAANFGAAFNAGIEEARQRAAQLGLTLSIPAPLPALELVWRSK